MRFAGVFLCMFLFLFQRLGLVDIDTGHEPVKLSPCQVSDLGLFPGPLVSTMYRQLFIDQYKTVSITVQGFDPGKRQTMRLTLKYTPLVYERRGFLHSSGRLSDHGIK